MSLETLYWSMNTLRTELHTYEDVVDGDDGVPSPNAAMNIANELEELLGYTPYLGRSRDVARIQAAIDEALDYLNHAHEVRFGYRS